MAEYYATPEEPPFFLFRGDDEDVPFIVWQDSTMAARQNITGATLIFTMRYWWDNAIIIELSTTAGTITITTPLQGEFDLNFTGTETTIPPGAYQYDITMILAGDRSILRRDGVEISENVSDIP
jgi:hypothetical protein